MDKRHSVLTLVVTVLLFLSRVESASPSASQADPGGPTAQITFTGRILDGQGAPVSGAKVTLYQATYGASNASPQIESLAEKTTGADGTCAFTAAKSAESHRQGYVLVRKEGLALGWTTWRMQGDQRQDITLGLGKELSGEVVDEQGQPIAEADVSIAVGLIGKMQDERYLMSWGSIQPLRVSTDRSGHFVFENMPVEATFEFLAKKSGRATACTLEAAAFRSEKCQFSPGQSGIKVVLPPEATIKGVIVEKAGGKPVGGTEVMAALDPRGWPAINEAVASGADGVFHIGGLAAGSYLVQLAVTAGPKVQWVAEPVPVSLKAGETRSDIKLQLSKGGIIEVLVQDSAGKPVEKASVSVHRLEGQQYVSAQTDGTGLGRLRVTPGQYGFSGAYKDGYTRDQRAQEQQIAVEEGATKRIEYVLQSAPKIAGTVRDEAGHPLAGVKIEIKPMGGPSENTTDAEGRFEVSWDPRSWGPQGTTIVLVARDEAHNLAEVVEIEEQSSRLDVTLKPGGIITGFVLNEEGQPLAGAHVRMTLIVARWGSSLGRGDLATSGPDGRFEVRAVPPEQRYVVTAVADGYGKHDVPVNPGAMQDGRFEAGQFKLTPATLSISGVVVDPNDKPVAGASVYGYGNGQPDLRNIQTDAEGKFTIKGVCPGPIRLNVNSRGRPYLYGNMEVEGGATDVRIVISDRSTGQPYAARRAPSLKGKPLPPWKDLGIDLPAEAEGKMLLVCFWDMGQRPSRYCLTQLAAQAVRLGAKGVVVAAVHAAKVEDSALSQWMEKNKVSFTAGTIAGDLDKAKLAWGVNSLPHLILTDRKHVVMAEGFGLGDLDQQIETAATR